MRNFAYVIITVICLIIINSCKTCECPAYSKVGNVKASRGLPKWEKPRAKQRAGYYSGPIKITFYYNCLQNVSIPLPGGIKHTYLPTRPEIAV